MSEVAGISDINQPSARDLLLQRHRHLLRHGCFTIPLIEADIQAQECRGSEKRTLRLNRVEGKSIAQLKRRGVRIARIVVCGRLRKSSGVAVVLAPELGRIIDAVTAAEDGAGCAEDVVGEAKARTEVFVFVVAE